MTGRQTTAQSRHIRRDGDMATLMRAAVWEQPGKPLSIQERPLPEFGPEDVLVEVRASGVCFTDLRVIDGRSAGDPLILGHESVGVIAAVGASVTEDLKLGDSVAVHALFACGDCAYCLRGEDEACVLGISQLAGFGIDGGYAEYLRAPARRVVPLPDGLDCVEAAPFCCAGLTVYAALRNGGIEAASRAIPWRRWRTSAAWSRPRCFLPPRCSSGSTSTRAASTSPQLSSVSRRCSPSMA